MFSSLVYNELILKHRKKIKGFSLHIWREWMSYYLSIEKTFSETDIKINRALATFGEEIQTQNFLY